MVKIVPSFDGYSLQNNNFIISNINYRSAPNRTIETEQITRRPGTRLLNSEFSTRTVSLQGHIVAENIDELQDLIDEFNKNVTRNQTGGNLVIQEGRSGNAIVNSTAIQDAQYTQDYVPFSVEFLMFDPFFYGAQQSLSFTVTSGQTDANYEITISGSYFCEPIISYIPPDATGNTTTSGITITYTPTNERITWSGGGSPLGYGEVVSFDYENKQITKGELETDWDGVFARWEPVETSFTVTFSGVPVGGTLDFAYQPRYL